MGDIAAAGETCAQCSKALTPDDRVASVDRFFCRSCYATLRQELAGVGSEMSANVNWAGAVTGAVLGGAVGALVWWGFTVLTHIALGLIAIGIGFLVGHATVRFSGGKRTAGLQALSVGVALVSFVVAVYLVNMSLINEAFAKEGQAMHLGFPPASADLFVRVVAADFGVMDFVFLAIVVYEAWKIPRPIALPADAAA